MDGIKFLGSRHLIDSYPSIKQSEKSETISSESFMSTLNQAIEKVNQLQQSANRKAEQFAVGQTDNIADVMIAMEKADIALRLMMQVRNKIIEGYQEIMKMQV